MKKVSIMLLLVIILTIVSACSMSKDDSGASSNHSSDIDQQENNETDSDDSSSKNNNTEEESTTTKESGDITSDFDVTDYLNKNYAIANTHYVADSWESEDTGRTNYTVKILPDTEEFGEEINEIFLNGSPQFDDERTIAMFDVAGRIMNELPALNQNIHVDSVNWVSYDGEFNVMLIQDYENSGGKVEEKESLSQYSSEQIEYARVWLQLGPNQGLDELYVRHISEGTPINPNDENSASYPENVIQLAGSRLVDGSVTYSGNGDGTINVYNVPLRWDGDYTNIDETFYTDLIEQTELVYINPGDEQSVIKLIKLITVEH